MQVLKQPRAVRTREKLLREATRLFTTRGYHDTKLDEVLQAAGVTSGAFFHHFRGKEELGFAVLDWYLERRHRELDEIEHDRHPAGSDGPLEEVFHRLDATVERLRARMERHEAGCIFGNLSTTLCETHEGFRRRLAECFEAMAEDLKPRLDRAAEAYLPGQQLDTGRLARYIVSVLEGSIILARARQDAEIIAEHFELLREHLRATFGTWQRCGGPHADRSM